MEIKTIIVMDKEVIYKMTILFCNSTDVGNEDDKIPYVECPFMQV